MINKHWVDEMVSKLKVTSSTQSLFIIHLFHHHQCALRASAHEFDGLFDGWINCIALDGRETEAGEVVGGGFGKQVDALDLAILGMRQRGMDKLRAQAVSLRGGGNSHRAQQRRRPVDLQHSAAEDLVTVADNQRIFDIIGDAVLGQADDVEQGKQRRQIGAVRCFDDVDGWCKLCLFLL